MIDGIDITQENLDFLETYLKQIDLSQYKSVQRYIRELSSDSDFLLSDQLKKIRNIALQDFTKELDQVEHDYDTIIAPYSIGCVKTLDDYEKAIYNMFKHLKKRGKALFLGTTGTSTNDIIPEYCYQGVRNDARELERIFKKYFQEVEIQEVELEKSEHDMYPYTSLILVVAKK